MDGRIRTIISIRRFKVGTQIMSWKDDARIPRNCNCQRTLHSNIDRRQERTARAHWVFTLVHLDRLRLSTLETVPYAGSGPSRLLKGCSMSSSPPSLLVHRPFGNCRAACVGIPFDDTNNATFSYVESCSSFSQSSYPRF